MSPQFAILVAMGFGWLGATVWALRLYLIGEASRRWPTAQGRIVSVLVKTIPGNRMTTFAPSIDYSYRVGDKEYEGHRIDASPGHTAFTQRGAAKVLEGYFPNRPVLVHYHPKRPHESLLKPGASGGMRVVAGSLIFGGLAFAGLWKFFS